MMMLWFVTPLPTRVTFDGLTMVTSVLAVIWLTTEITPTYLLISIILAHPKVSLFHMEFGQFAAMVRGHLPISRVLVRVLGSIYLLPTLSPSLFVVSGVFVWLTGAEYGSGLLAAYYPVMAGSCGRSDDRWLVGWDVLQPGVFDGVLWHASAGIRHLGVLY